MVLTKTIIFIVLLSASKANNNSIADVIACHDETKFNKSHIRVEDVLDRSLVHMWCHFCSSEEDYYPKLWFFKGSESKQFQEISIINIDKKYQSLKFTITPAHVLAIEDFNFNYSGMYICSTHNPKRTYKYVLDSVFGHVGMKYGSEKQWTKYRREFMDPKNKMFKLSKEEPFETMREKLNISLELCTTWENWTKCKEIDYKNSIRKRLGKCRLRSTHNALSKVGIGIYSLVNDLNHNYFYLNKSHDIPCRSKTLYKAIPEISLLIRDIPDYEIQEKCLNSSRTEIKSKIKTLKKVTENSHVALWCSEATPYSSVEWFKDEALLNSIIRNSLTKNEEERRISVDTNKTLHILHIRKSEEGIYSCVVNGEKIQEIEIKVLSVSKVLNQDFFRYSIYLGFVLSVTMTCYCAGVCVAWNHRGSFADPIKFNKRNYQFNDNK